ncbi:hypothetical protein BDR07DRAFT_1403855 [Suillus spraguei]|nr:hypothetical protein BDR07DRAFT_1403855 [Suillus spraguei]
MHYLSHFMSERRILCKESESLRNQVTYTRFLPALSAHSFTYSTLFIFVSHTDLESNGINLLGRLFWYGSVWRNVIGLRADRPKQYLDDKHAIIWTRAKLEYALSECGFGASVPGCVQHV